MLRILIYHASAQGIKIDEVESTLSGDVDLHGFLGLDENVRNGYEKIKVTFKIKSDAPEQKLRELVELAQKRSPVFDIVSHPTAVEVVWKRNNKHFTSVNGFINTLPHLFNSILYLVI